MCVKWHSSHSVLDIEIVEYFHPHDDLHSHQVKIQVAVWIVDAAQLAPYFLRGESVF